MPSIAEKDIMEGERTADWMLIADEVDGYVLVAETSEVEAIELRSLAEARRRLDWHLWETTIHEELAVLHDARTLRLTVAPSGANIVVSNWVFRAKKDAAGNIVRYKAHLVAQGFSQVPGIDYFDMFAPVAKLASIRTVLALCVGSGFPVVCQSNSLDFRV
jgi:Reverse transcriptase (RNA-dependent DNA polymerase)